MTHTILFYGAAIPAQGDTPLDSQRFQSPLVDQSPASNWREASSEMETTLFLVWLGSVFKPYQEYGY